MTPLILAWGLCVTPPPPEPTFCSYGQEPAVRCVCDPITLECRWVRGCLPIPAEELNG